MEDLLDLSRHVVIDQSRFRHACDFFWSPTCLRLVAGFEQDRSNEIWAYLCPSLTCGAGGLSLSHTGQLSLAILACVGDVNVW